MAAKEAFSIPNSNRFAGLEQGDSSDGEDIPEKQINAAVTTKTANLVESWNQPQITAHSTNTSAEYHDWKEPGQFTGGRGNRNRRGIEGLSSSRNVDDFSYEEMPRKGVDDRRGRGGRGSPFSTRGQRGTGTTRHREFDRHVSGTNRNRGMKREGAGTYNWGDMNGGYSNMEVNSNVEQSEVFARKSGLAFEDLSNVDGEIVEAASSNNFSNVNSGRDAIVSSEKERQTNWDDISTEAEKQGALPEETQENNAVVKAPQAEERLIGFEEYLQMQAVKRANLPSLPTVSVPSVAVQRSEMEREGYMLHVKEKEIDSKRVNVLSINPAPTATDRPIRSREALNRKHEPQFFNEPTRGGRGGRGGKNVGTPQHGGQGNGRGKYEFANNERHDVNDLVKNSYVKLDLDDADAFPSL